MSNGNPTTPSPVTDTSLDIRVRAEMVRTAYDDARYGAPFAIAVAVLFGASIYGVFPSHVVFPWLAFVLVCNILRLVSRWAYFRHPVPLEDTGFWSRRFVAVSAATGLSWGIAAWLFYTPEDSIYRVMIVLVLAGLTTGASRLLAPIIAANLAYVYLAIGPLQARLMVNADTRGYVLGAMCVMYLGYMSLAARQQVRTLRRTIRLGYENTTLVESLGAAKERAEQLNRDLSAEIARREVVEKELRTASEHAVAASRAKSDFLATMSHEIRTPMNGIIGMLRIVRDTPLTPAQRDHVDTAAASADTLLDLLSDILDFSKIEAGHLELERIAFSPAAVVKSVVDLLRPRATAKGLELTLEMELQPSPTLLGDPVRIRQVLFNLIGNAVKFTDRGSVRVRVSGETNEPGAATVRFSVHDTGIGMDKEAYSRIFRPFTQADSSMSRRFGGSGLGLAISQKLIGAMGSRIVVRSEAGRGSEFEFSLTLSRVAPSAAVVETKSGLPLQLPQLRGRVLIVEDERVNQRVIGHFLQRMGLDSGLAETGLEAVELALTGKWDAVLMDCQLPGIDGIEATRRIRRHDHGRTLPIIALTANASTEDRAACFAAGMNDFLTKPVRVELLATALRKWLPVATSPQNL